MLSLYKTDFEVSAWTKSMDHCSSCLQPKAKKLVYIQGWGWSLYLYYAGLQLKACYESLHFTYLDFLMHISCTISQFIKKKNPLKLYISFEFRVFSCFSAFSWLSSQLLFSSIDLHVSLTLAFKQLVFSPRVMHESSWYNSYHLFCICVLLKRKAIILTACFSSCCNGFIFCSDGIFSTDLNSLYFVEQTSWFKLWVICVWITTVCFWMLAPHLLFSKVKEK